MTTFMNAKNFAQSTLASGITASDTSLTVQSGDGAKFPSSAPFNLVLSGSEIVRVTAVAGDTFTIQRAQEGTVAQGHNAGASVELNVTAKYLTDAYTAINNIESGTTILQRVTTAGDVNTTAATINLFADATTINIMNGTSGSNRNMNLGAPTPLVFCVSTRRQALRRILVSASILMARKSLQLPWPAIRHYRMRRSSIRR